MKKTLFIILIYLLLIPSVLAQKDSIKLLAVNDAGKKGTVVDLDLEVIEGSGRVFIETYPLSQIDTQISLRIAKIIACKKTQVYCLNKDFIFSLKTESPVIAGPSAGAAMTILTLSALENKRIDPYATITGTINSGGVVGIVGGVKEKIKGAASYGIKKVLIPRGEENSTKLIEYGKNLNVTVIEVSNIDEAYEILTGTATEYPELTINKNYEDIMKGLNSDICGRVSEIKDKIGEYPVKYNKTYLLAENLTKEGERLTRDGLYYSGASKCFGANVYFRETLLGSLNLSNKDITVYKNDTIKKLEELEAYLNKTKIDNLGDLEAVMIIRERIFDAKNNLLETNATNVMREMAYAIERTYSAFAWSKFIGFPGKKIDETKLKESCALKLNEVQELYNYVAIYSPSLVNDVKKELDSVKGYSNSGDYILCLFKASKSEAEINVALSAFYITDDNVNILLENKILAAKKEIQKQIMKGTFPILGYSYYEYSTTLKNSSKYDALLYAEYGIELSNLDIYLPSGKPLPITINEKALITLILGFVIGIALLSIRKQYRHKRIVLKRRR